MTVLVVENLAKSFGADLVFSDVSFTVGRGERVGLVGPNGSGKTTLLDIITGRLSPDAGRARVIGATRVGYLRQEVKPGGSEGSLFEHALGAMSALTRRKERLARIEEEMAGLGADCPELTALVDEYGALREAFEREGGYNLEARVREVLFGLGFGERDLTLPLGGLSGGQRTRAHLARLLLEGPDLLILDEPTNHLDLQALEWLEAYLGALRGSVLVVSHDRFFLDHVATKILELEEGRLTSWSGNYTAYAAQKEASLTQARRAFERQQEDIQRLEDYIRRYMAGNRTTMAQSRQKALDRLERLKRPSASRKTTIRFTPAEMTGRDVLRLDAVGFAFPNGSRAPMSPQTLPAAPERWLFRGLKGLVRRGERVALLGRNGVGKTTLLEVAVGSRSPSEGRVRWGAGVRVGYFAQGRDQLVDSRSVLDEVMEATGFDIPTARSYLGRFLFSGDSVYKLVSALSGGERNRLVLACLVSSSPNVLVLDEPTNHLDLPAREALEQALTGFAGTIIFVSHDRYFIERLATRVWELEDGSLADFAGGYREYRLAIAEERLRRACATPPTRPGKPGDLGRSPADRGQTEPSVEVGGTVGARGKGEAPPGAQPLSKGRRAQLQRRLDETQDLISRLERQRGEIEGLMADPASYRQGGGGELSARYRKVLSDLETALQEWERLAAALEGAISRD